MFLIVHKDDLTSVGTAFKQLPMVVYGLLDVSGDSYEKSFVSYSHISDKVTPKELEEISELAKLRVWQVDWLMLVAKSRKQTC